MCRIDDTGFHQIFILGLLGVEPEAILALHDLVHHHVAFLAGVRRAVDEFFADKREKPIELPSTQCMVIKL